MIQCVSALALRYLAAALLSQVPSYCMLHAACFMDMGRGDHCSQLCFSMPVGGLQPTFDLPTLDQFVDNTVPLDSCTIHLTISCMRCSSPSCLAGHATCVSALHSARTAKDREREGCRLFFKHVLCIFDVSNQACHVLLHLKARCM